MKSELNLLEALLQQNNYTQDLTSLSNKLAKENKRIKKAWQHTVLNELPAMAKKYIQQHQIELVTMLNSSGTSKDHEPTYLIISCIKELLRYIEEHFAEFIAFDYRLPVNVCKEEAILFRERLVVLRDKMQQINVDYFFNKAIVNAFELSRLVAIDNQLTYRRAYQMRELYYGLLKLFEINGHEGNNLSRLLLLEFCRVNMNSVEAYAACKNCFKGELSNRETVAQQLALLKKQYHLVRHASSVKHLFFTYNYRGLSVGLAESISTQIKELQSKEHPIMHQDQPEEVVKDAEKIMTSLTRSELALMILLFFRTGVFINKFKTSVAKFMSVFVRTRAKRSEDQQSAGKLYDDMKMIKISTVDTVEVILNRMKRENAKVRAEILAKVKKTNS